MKNMGFLMGLSFLVFTGVALASGDTYKIISIGDQGDAPIFSVGTQATLTGGKLYINKTLPKVFTQDNDTGISVASSIMGQSQTYVCFANGKTFDPTAYGCQFESDKFKSYTGEAYYNSKKGDKITATFLTTNNMDPANQVRNQNTNVVFQKVS